MGGIFFKMEENKKKANLNEKRTMAQSLFIKGITQKEIAEITGISEQSISKWRKKYDWDNLFEQHNVTRASLLKQSYEQLAAVNKEILANNNIPTKAQSDSKAQLLREIEKFSDTPMYKYIEVFEELISWLSKTDPKNIKFIAEITWKFIDDKQSLNAN